MTVIVDSAQRADPAVAVDQFGRVRAEIGSYVADSALMAGLEARAAAICRVGRGALVARELVWDVIGDVYAGAVSWQPDGDPNPDRRRERFQRWVIKHVTRRASHERALRRLHTTLGDVSDEETEPDAAGDSWSQLDPVDVSAVCDELRRRASDDPDVLQLMDLYMQGITRKAKIRAVGMSDSAYATRGAGSDGWRPVR